MNKEETNKTECETKEFDRSVCFSFFKIIFRARRKGEQIVWC